jgi:hypothetical protein
MARMASRRSWMPQLWEGARSWHFAQFRNDTIRTFPELLIGTLVGLVVERFTRSSCNLLRIMIHKCADEIGKTPNEVLFRCNPIYVTLAVRLIRKEGIPLAANVLEYLQFVRDAMDDGSVPRWQVPALESLLRTRRAASVTSTVADSPPEDYLSNFGQVLGSIECETEYGTKKAILGLRALSFMQGRHGRLR